MLAPPKMYRRPLEAARPNMQRGEGVFPRVLLLRSRHSSTAGSNTCRSSRYAPESAQSATYSQTDHPQAIHAKHGTVTYAATETTSSTDQRHRLRGRASTRENRRAAAGPDRQPPKTKSRPAADAKPWPILGAGARPRASALTLVHWRASGSYECRSFRSADEPFNLPGRRVGGARPSVHGG